MVWEVFRRMKVWMQEGEAIETKQCAEQKEIIQRGSESDLPSRLRRNWVAEDSFCWTAATVEWPLGSSSNCGSDDIVRSLHSAEPSIFMKQTSASDRRTKQVRKGMFTMQETIRTNEIREKPQNLLCAIIRFGNLGLSLLCRVLQVTDHVFEIGFTVEVQLEKNKLNDDS